MFDNQLRNIKQWYQKPNNLRKLFAQLYNKDI